MDEKIKKTEEEWKKILSDDVFEITRNSSFCHKDFKEIC